MIEIEIENVTKAVPEHRITNRKPEYARASNEPATL